MSKSVKLEQQRRHRPARRRRARWPRARGASDSQLRRVQPARMRVHRAPRRRAEQPAPLLEHRVDVARRAPRAPRRRSARPRTAASAYCAILLRDALPLRDLRRRAHGAAAAMPEGLRVRRRRQRGVLPTRSPRRQVAGQRDGTRPAAPASERYSISCHAASLRGEPREQRQARAAGERHARVAVAPRRRHRRRRPRVRQRGRQAARELAEVPRSGDVEREVAARRSPGRRWRPASSPPRGARPRAEQIEVERRTPSRNAGLRKSP